MLTEHWLHLLKNHGLHFCPLASLSAPEAGRYSGLWSAASTVSGTEPYTGLDTRSGDRVQLPETLCSCSFPPLPQVCCLPRSPWSTSSQGLPPRAWAAAAAAALTAQPVLPRPGAPPAPSPPPAGPSEGQDPAPRAPLSCRE